MRDDVLHGWRSVRKGGACVRRSVRANEFRDDIDEKVARAFRSCARQARSVASVQILNLSLAIKCTRDTRTYIHGGINQPQTCV